MITPPDWFLVLKASIERCLYYSVLLSTLKLKELHPVSWSTRLVVLSVAWVGQIPNTLIELQNIVLFGLQCMLLLTYQQNVGAAAQRGPSSHFRESGISKDETVTSYPFEGTRF